MKKEKKKIIIMGAGPAGLSAGYVLVKNGYEVEIYEKDDVVGGISRTINYKGYRFDVGGHRFFTKIKKVEELWFEILRDEFLTRPRLSRIYYNKKFFDYPLKIKNVLLNLGLFESFLCVMSYLKSKIKPHKQEVTFEQWVSNRFGKRLYEKFFKTYTEKLWGIPCSEIQAEWAAQRIKGLSFVTAIKNALLGDKNKKIKTLIDEFLYPKFGPGQMYEAMAEKIIKMGGKIFLNNPVEKIKKSGDSITSIVIKQKEQEKEISGDYFISNIPIDDLIKNINPPFDPEIIKAAERLSYRSLLTINLIFHKNIDIKDNWIYVHEPEVNIGRVQFFKNWSPYMVPNENHSNIALEYFCSQDDGLWNTEDTKLIEFGKQEITKTSIAEGGDAIEGFVVRMAKTYPVYNSEYKKEVEKIKTAINKFKNLQPVGRYGLFKYNNMDHSILTGICAAENIMGEKHNIWEINTDDEYQEETKA